MTSAPPGPAASCERVVKTYRTATPWQAEGPALRFHIGLEDLDDLKRDLDAGFSRLRAG